MSQLKTASKQADADYDKMDSLSGMQFLQSWSNGLEQVCGYEYQLENNQQDDEDIFQQDLEDHDTLRSRNIDFELFCHEPHSDEEVREALSSMSSLVIRPSSLSSLDWDKLHPTEPGQCEDEPSLYSLCNMSRLQSELWTPTASSSLNHCVSRSASQCSQLQEDGGNVMKKGNHMSITKLNMPVVAEVPVLKPSAAELNNLPEFVRSIDAVGRFHGAVKLVPPSGWLEHKSTEREKKLASWKFCHEVKLYHDDHDCGWYSIQRKQQPQGEFSSIKSSMLLRQQEYEEWCEDQKNMEIDFWRDIGSGQEIEYAQSSETSLFDDEGRSFLGGKHSEASQHTVFLGMSRAVRTFILLESTSAHLVLLTGRGLDLLVQPEQGSICLALRSVQDSVRDSSRLQGEVRAIAARDQQVREEMSYVCRG
eukprot:758557-Hanusia_phi.AAC.1